MSSPFRVLGSVSPAAKGRNAKRRILSDSEDAEERDPKRVKPLEAVGDQGKCRDSKEKRKRRKKRRKVSVVESAPESDAESPTVATKPALSRIRSRSVTISDPDGPVVAPPSKMTRDDARQPSAGPSSIPALEAKLQSPLPERDLLSPPPLAPSTTPKASPSLDKGKGRATPDADALPNDSQQLADLQKHVADKTSLVSKHETLVSSLQQSLSCQICLDLMHRPYALAPCGHSACYQCLVNWFKAPPPDIPPDEVIPVLHRKKTCPHCRAVVRDRPIEIWSLKEMVATLVKSGLATGFYNTAPEQLQGGANADPWVGIFRPAGGQHAFGGVPFPAAMQEIELMGLRDDEDAVYRCLDCNHEIWDGMCSHCGRDYPGHDGHDFDLDDGSEDSDDGIFPFPHGAREGLRSLFRHLLQPGDHNHAHDLLMADARAPGDREWDGGGDTEIESVDDGDAGPRGPARGRAPRRASISILSSDDEEAGYESSFIDDDDGDAPRAPEGVDCLDDEEDGDGVQIRPPRLRGPYLSRRDLAAFLDGDDGDDDEEYHGDDGSDRSHSHDGASEDDDLADEVAAREFEMYGDDGSIPRGGREYDSNDSEDELY